jgi:alpha-ketoglutarate-dependent taurine dioxygenase
MSMPHVRSGDIIQDIFPTLEEKGKASSSYGSEKEFVFHNDQSYCANEQDIPRIVMLGCVRNIERVQTLFGRVDDAIQDLDNQKIEQLKQPNFTFGHIMRKPDGTKEPSTNISPVLLENGEVRLGVDMTASDGDSLDALKSLRRAVLDHSVNHTLEPGDVVIIPNRTFVHARTSFTMASKPEQRRWLKRINIR